MRPEYDFSGGVRGKYAQRYAEGPNVVVLDPDVTRVFAKTESVNRALRALVRIIEEQTARPAAAANTLWVTRTLGACSRLDDPMLLHDLAGSGGDRRIVTRHRRWKGEADEAYSVRS
jgi:hypothetical protein